MADEIANYRILEDDYSLSLDDNVDRSYYPPAGEILGAALASGKTDITIPMTFKPSQLVPRSGISVSRLLTLNFQSCSLPNPNDYYLLLQIHREGENSETLGDVNLHNSASKTFQTPLNILESGIDILACKNGATAVTATIRSLWNFGDFSLTTEGGIEWQSGQMSCQGVRQDFT